MLAFLRRIIGPVVGKNAAMIGTGVTIAAADGTCLWEDVVGFALAVGGTALSAYDLVVLRRDLPDSISAALQQANRDYWQYCRLEAAQ